MLRVTHMSELPDNASTCESARKKKIDWQNPPVTRAALPLPPYVSQRSMSVPSRLWLWMTDSLFACRHVKQKSPTAMCRPTLNFFSLFPPHAINSFIFHFLFIWRFLVSLLCVFACFFPFDMLNENEIITSTFFLCMIDGGF